MRFLRAAFAVFFFCRAEAADAEYKRILVQPGQDAVEVRLPLTDVTGPARVKRMEAAGVGIPVAPTRIRLDDAAFIEWQIGYDTTDPRHWSVAPGIEFERAGRKKYGCELSKLLAESRRLGLLSETELRAVRQQLDSLRAATLEDTEKLTVGPDTAPGHALPEGFARYVERVPIFEKNTPCGRIEIQLKQKQRAVGYQAMVYACLPLAQWRTSDGSARGPGAARSKETVIVRFTRDNVSFLLDIVRAFGIASREHNDDLRKILDALLAL